MDKKPQASSRQVTRWQSGQVPCRRLDQLAIEEPLEIQVDTRPVVVTMRTPGHDQELAAGFLLSEGLIRKRADLLKITPHVRNETGNVLGVFLSPEVPVDFSRLTRHVFVSSSCGLCGKASIEAVHAHFKKIKSSAVVNPRTLLALPAKLRRQQRTFEQTGGLHAAAIFTTAGRLLIVREDVGRHNAVDKVLGHALLHNLLPLDRHLLLVSGRASFEIIQKALAARIAIIAAVSAPSTLAVEFAQASNQTLVGFLREDHFNIYSRPQRIRSS